MNRQRTREELANIVVEAVCRQFGVPRESIVSPGRGTRRVSNARHAAFAVLRVEFGWSWHAIGDTFGRDHASVLRGVDAVRRRSRHSQHHWQAVALATQEAAALAAMEG